MENKKTFKEVVKEHKYQIIAGAACITTGVVSYLLFKEKANTKMLNNCMKDLVEEHDLMKADFELVAESLANKVEVIHEAMSEGMVQEAIATTTRKLNTRMDIIDRLKAICDYEYDERYIKAVEEAAIFKRRLAAFNKLAETYTIED